MQIQDIRLSLEGNLLDLSNDALRHAHVLTTAHTLGEPGEDRVGDLIREIILQDHLEGILEELSLDVLVCSQFPLGHRQDRDYQTLLLFGARVDVEEFDLFE